MAGNQLAFAIRAVNEASAVLKSVQGDIDAVGTASEKSSGSTSKFSGALGRVAEIAGGFIVADGLKKLPGLVSGFIGGASDLSESLSKAQVVFGDSSGTIESFAKSAATNLGMSRSAALDAAGTFGNLFVAMGLGKQPAADLTQNIIKLGTDLASFNNLAPEEALEKLRAGLVGEAEPLRALGINMNEAAVKAKAMELGLVGANGEISEASKVQARYAIIMDQTKVAQGDFARTSDGLANQSRILKAELADIGNNLGTLLIPALTTAAGFITGQLIPAAVDFANEAAPKIQDAFATIGNIAQPVIEKIQPLADWFIHNQDAMTAAAVGIGAVMATAFTAWAVSAGAAAAATLLAAAPIIGIGVAVAALAAGIYLLITHWDDITAKFPALGTAADGVKQALASFGGWITSSFVPAVQEIADTVSDVVGDAIGFVKDHWHEIEDVISPAVQAVALVVQTYWAQIQTEIETVIGVIKGVLDIFIGVFTGDWDRAWKGAKEVVTSVWNGMKETIENAIGLIKGLMPIAQDAGKAILQGLWDGAKEIWDLLIGWIEELPGKIVAGLGDAGKILYDVGKKVIEGLWDGMESMLGWFGDRLGSVGGFISDHKGPVEKDHMLLYPHGQAIIDGLWNGMESRLPMLQQNLAGVSSLIKGAIPVAVPAIGNSYADQQGAGPQYDPATQVSQYPGTMFWSNGHLMMQTPSGPIPYETWQAQGSPQYSMPSMEGPYVPPIWTDGGGVGGGGGGWNSAPGPNGTTTFTPTTGAAGGEWRYDPVTRQWTLGTTGQSDPVYGSALTPVPGADGWVTDRRTGQVARVGTGGDTAGNPGFSTLPDQSWQTVPDAGQFAGVGPRGQAIVINVQANAVGMTVQDLTRAIFDEAGRVMR